MAYISVTRQPIWTLLTSQIWWMWWSEVCELYIVLVGKMAYPTCINLSLCSGISGERKKRSTLGHTYLGCVVDIFVYYCA